MHTTHTHIACNHQQWTHGNSVSISSIEMTLCQAWKVSLVRLHLFPKNKWTMNVKFSSVPMYELLSWNYCAEEGHRKYLPTVFLGCTNDFKPQMHKKRICSPSPHREQRQRKTGLHGDMRFHKLKMESKSRNQNQHASLATLHQWQIVRPMPWLSFCFFQRERKQL